MTPHTWQCSDGQPKKRRKEVRKASPEHSISMLPANNLIYIRAQEDRPRYKNPKISRSIRATEEKRDKKNEGVR
jgi:hypothetical protein